MLPYLQRAAEAALAADLRLVDKRHGWRGAPAAARREAARRRAARPGASGWRRPRAQPGEFLVWDLGRVDPDEIEPEARGQGRRPAPGPGAPARGRRDLHGAGDEGGGQARHARPGRRHGASSPSPTWPGPASTTRRSGRRRRGRWATCSGPATSCWRAWCRAASRRSTWPAPGSRCSLSLEQVPRVEGALVAIDPATRGDPRAGGRPGLRPLPVQPGHPGEAAARQRLQALRVGRRHRVGALHAGHGGLRHARPLPGSLDRQGVEAAELREGRLRGADAAARRARPLEEHRLGEAHRRARRGGGDRLRAPVRDRERAPAQPLAGAGHRRGDAARAGERLRDARRRRLPGAAHPRDPGARPGGQRARGDEAAPPPTPVPTSLRPPRRRRPPLGAGAPEEGAVPPAPRRRRWGASRIGSGPRRPTSRWP